MSKFIEKITFSIKLRWDPDVGIYKIEVPEIAELGLIRGKRGESSVDLINKAKGKILAAYFGGSQGLDIEFGHTVISNSLLIEFKVNGK